MIKKIQLSLAVLAILLLTACSVLPGGGTASLNDSSWILISYGGELPLPGTTMSANFDRGEVSGSASCNHYFGTYQAKGDKIQVTGLGWTEMACMDPEGIMLQEQEIMRILGKASSYRFSGSRLEIIASSGEVLAFERMP